MHHFYHHYLHHDSIHQNSCIHLLRHFSYKLMSSRWEQRIVLSFIRCFRPRIRHIHTQHRNFESHDRVTNCTLSEINRYSNGTRTTGSNTTSYATAAPRSHQHTKPAMCCHSFRSVARLNKHRIRIVQQQWKITSLLPSPLSQLSFGALDLCFMPSPAIPRTAPPALSSRFNCNLFYSKLRHRKTEQVKWRGKQTWLRFMNKNKR